MKKTLLTVLIFAVILGVLLGAASLAERFRPAEPEETAQPEPEEKTIPNAMTPDKATLIQMEGSRATLRGAGARFSEGTVTIGYPGTYRLSGELEGGLVVDTGDFDGAVYLILDDAHVTCADGPALYVKQSDLTVLYLEQDTVNHFRDGGDYVIPETGGEQTGAGVFSADELLIHGDGALTVVGSCADGIRSKDGLTISGGRVTVFSADDGLQASDAFTLEEGTVTLYASGDGVNVLDGGFTMTGGTLAITAGGDGIGALTEVSVNGGVTDIKAGGGWEKYADMALADMSAKGIKGDYIALTGGIITLDTADDAVHARKDALVDGDVMLSIACGDDGIKAIGTLDVGGGSVNVAQSYEALEGDGVLLRGGTVLARAENNGIDAGEGGVTVTGGEIRLDAPRCVDTEDAFNVTEGRLYLTADGTESPLSFARGDLTGGSLVLCAAAGRSDVLLEKARPAGGLLFVLDSAVPAGTAATLRDPSGGVVLSLVTTGETGAILVCGGALTDQTYTLTAGENELSLTRESGDCAVYEAPLPTPQAGSRGFGPGGPRR